VQDYNGVYRDKGVLVMINRACEKGGCFAWTTPNRYKNCCTALEEVPEGECPFFKSRGQIADEKLAMRMRAKVDADYRRLLESYGITFSKRGRKSDGD